MPLSLRLPPLFARRKTTSSSGSSEPDSGATTAASSTGVTSPSCSDLKKSNSSILQSRRGRSKASTERAPSVSSLDKNRRQSSSPPPSTALQSSFGVDSSLLLGSVGEEKEDLDGASKDAINTRPALVLHEATPPAIDTEQTSDRALQQQKHQQQPEPIPQSPLRSHSLIEEDPPISTDTLSLPQALSNASAGLVDRTNATVVQKSEHKLRMTRKIWVRRPGASATLVQIREDDLVDDVREMILRKYANSLGRTFDAPDMTLRIVDRNTEPGVARSERTLGPEEEIGLTIDTAYPGGQTVEEALVIDVPIRRTPKASPRVPYHHAPYQSMEDYRPVESGTDYFPPMPAIVQPMVPQSNFAANHQHYPQVNNQEHSRSMAILTTGQLPPLPSPGMGRRDRHRPKIGRQHTSSPTIVQHNAPAGVPMPSIPANIVLHRASTRPRIDSSASDTLHPLNGIAPHPPPLPTPPAAEAFPPGKGGHASTPPTPQSQVSGLAPGRNARPKKPRKTTGGKPFGRSLKERHGSHDLSAQLGMPPRSNMLEGIVPPINVLIVEDNHINLRVLEGLMKRIKVRWDSAVNGQIAVDKWRKGGYHLVLMDIQMPVMNGLQATKEIRRLEKVNGIGVFSSSAPSSPAEIRARAQKQVTGKETQSQLDSIETDGEMTETDTQDALIKSEPNPDKLTKIEGNFKSPIIIVALTASSLQSDRHEALAAGCNDFLTKPVQVLWLERKVKEWGCMQALIDFDGWKRWRDINEKDDQKIKDKQANDKSNKQLEKSNAKDKQVQTKEDQQKNKAAADVSTDESTTVNGTGFVNGH